MDKLLAILNDIRPDIDFTTATNMVDGGELDSFDVVMIVPEINEAFEISVPIADINPENFNSAEAMLSLIKRLKG
jgi:acyl carrier protein